MIQFRIEQIIAGGTFGTVCVVRDQDGERHAVKALKTEHLENPRVVSRLRDEAMLLSRLDHPNIVKVQDLIEFRDRPVIVMEWIQGCNLEELIAHHRHGLPVAEALEMVQAAASALDAAWSTQRTDDGAQLRVIHRDIKPSNLLLTAEGVLKVVDFGTAQGRFEGRESETISMVLGARAYLAPERLDGAEDKPQGDVYALGHVLYELIEGAPIQLSLHPFHHQKMLEAHLAEIRVDALNEQAQALRELIGAMCSYDPGDRPSHGEVADRLSAISASAQLKPDLPALASKLVAPLLQRRARTDPRRHPAWNEVAFLESDTAQRAGSTPPIDDRIRAFLQRPDWYVEIDALRALLSTDANWSAQPFVELLDGAATPWWQFWSRDKLAPEEIAAVLETLQQRPSPGGAARARDLVRHSDPQVKYLAGELLTRAASTG
ncbi:MAG: serine/threonine protein kinase [Myxococcota bacterium]|jgi:serine/threonine protein kinase